MQASFYQQLNEVLKNQGQGIPALVVDQASLDTNIAYAQQQLGHLKPRLVVKSLESMPLINYIAAKLNCQRFMVFHAPHLPLVLQQFPQADILLGKPMPIAAVRHFYQQYPQHKNTPIQWLVDSLERLQQYLQLAMQQQIRLQINIEIDIGLHRGGLQQPEKLQPLLQLISQHPQCLKFSGLMGYDAHVSKIPAILQSLEKSYQQSQASYQQFIDYIQQHFAWFNDGQLCFNGSGSPTFSLHCHQSVCNDIAFGSMLLKPTDFDITTLDQLKPALFIAAPVLKILPYSQLPGLSRLDKLLDQLPYRQKALFVYGGNWLADYVYPTGAKTNLLYGRSSNQEMVNVPKSCSIATDDYVFLRPTQSEAIISQFSQLYIYDGSQLHAWNTFDA
ncbi:alanine racemase [Alkanindiges sp. WGS2144]|uniref:alanine racemase n=1 Tax=Alkanindiges sp. WGS2144 TaxID=3366808 RepID=UPI00375248DA